MPVAPVRANSRGRRLRTGSDSRLGKLLPDAALGRDQMAVAVLGAIVPGMEFIFTGGDKVTVEKIWIPALGDKYVMTPPGREGLTFLRQHPG